MKKTLALLLALLMLLSVVFVSCGEDEVEEPTDDPNDDFNFVTPSGNNSNGTGDSTSGGTGSSSSGFSPITENTTAYLLMSVNVRSNAKKSAASNGSVSYGKSVTRVEASSTWTKIKYTDSNGASKEGYVYNDVLTTDAGRVTYVAETSPIKTTSVTNKGTVRKVPWLGNDNYNTVIDQINGVDGDSYKLKEGQEVEILGKTQTADSSGFKWAWIKYTVGTSAVYGWCRMDLLSEGGTTTTPSVDPSTPTVPDPV